MIYIKFLKDLKELKDTDLDTLGGKALNLVKLYEYGYLVPDAFVILSFAYDDFIKENKISTKINLLLKELKSNPKKTKSISKNIKKLFVKAKISESLKNEIFFAYKQTGCKHVAVRSSAIAEDSKHDSWAGQLDTFLYTNVNNLLENIKLCWASIFNERALVYASQRKIKKRKAVAVIVQEMIYSEISGVAFSVNPVTKNKNQIVIEAVYGLGDILVSGKVTPDSFVVSKSFKILERNLSLKGNVGCLTNREITDISKSVLSVEKKFKFPVDVEWAISRGKFYFLQAREITTI